MGDKLKDLRKARRMSQTELAERSGVSRQTISAIESNGTNAATTKTLAKIAEALDTTVAALFFNSSV